MKNQTSKNQTSKNVKFDIVTNNFAPWENDGRFHAVELCEYEVDSHFSKADALRLAKKWFRKTVLDYSHDAVFEENDTKATSGSYQYHLASRYFPEANFPEFCTPYNLTEMHIGEIDRLMGFAAQRRKEEAELKERLKTLERNLFVRSSILNITGAWAFLLLVYVILQVFAFCVLAFGLFSESTFMP